MKMDFRFFGLALVVLWAALWAFFAVAAGFGEKPGMPQSLLPVVPCLLVLLASVLAAFRSAALGGYAVAGVGVLLMISVFTYLQKSPDTTRFLFFALALPPVIAGLLLLVSGYIPHQSGV